MLATLDVELNDTGFKVALALIGAGAGLLASQLGNVIMSSVAGDQEQRGRRAPGHRTEPRRLARNGAHRRGSALVAGYRLRSSVLPSNPDIPEAAQETIVAKTEQGIDIVPVDDVEQAAVEGGLTTDQAKAVASDYGDAQLDALRLALGAVAARGAAVAVVHAATAVVRPGAERGRRGVGYRSVLSAASAALYPHIPWAPAPGGVAAEQI